MTKYEVLNWLKTSRIVPVVRAKSSDQALRIVDLLLEGGVDIFEITMTVPGAVEVIATLAKQHGDTALIGAGTVLDSETARACIGSGARFIVAPNTDPAVIEEALNCHIACAPGAFTPTEVVAAHKLGADIVKIFPCDAAGGAKYIKALKAPLPQIELMPTGGVDLTTVKDFLDAGACAVGVGSNLVDLKLLETNPKELTARAAAFREAVTSFG